MMWQNNDFEELGLKVQRAQQALEQVRGVGDVNGVRVVVDAENRLLSVSLPDGDSILAAYNAALADMQPRAEEATRELRSDSRVEAISLFTEANAARLEAERIQHAEDEWDDDYHDRRMGIRAP